MFTAVLREHKLVRSLCCDGIVCFYVNISERGD